MFVKPVLWIWYRKYARPGRICSGKQEAGAILLTHSISTQGTKQL